MARKPKSLAIGEGGPCPKCSKTMQRFTHPKGWKPKADQPYYFAYWDRCSPCMHLQHYDAAKVMRDGRRSAPPANPSSSAKPKEPVETADVEVWRAAARQALRWRLGSNTRRSARVWLAEAMGIEIWHADVDKMDRTELITVFDVCMKEKAPAA